MPLLVYSLFDEMTKRRIEDMSKRHFYELSGKLSNLYTSSSLDKAISTKELEEDINEKVQQLESENVHADDFHKAIAKFEKETRARGKEIEMDIMRRQM
jgi:uncharacterized protein YoxC